MNKQTKNNGRRLTVPR